MEKIKSESPTTAFVVCEDDLPEVQGIIDLMENATDGSLIVMTTKQWKIWMEGRLVQINLENAKNFIKGFKV